MDIRVKAGLLQEQPTDAIIVSQFEGMTLSGATQAVDQALDGVITDLHAGGDFAGLAGEVAVLYPRGALPARRVIVVGLGPQEDFSVETVRRAAGVAASKARDLGAKSVATVGTADQRFTGAQHN